jgi:hypothetical protein
MGKYLYGIIKSENTESFGNIGISNSEVYTIQYNDVGVTVSDIPENYKVGIEEVKIHEKALRKIMETHAIIPTSFGVIAKDEAEIKNILKRARMKFKKTLEKIDNKLQINVKISWDKAILATILKENEEIRALSREVREKADQSLRIELGRKVKSVLDERKSEYMKNIQGALKGLSNGFEENKIINQDTVMNASVLVDKKREQEFYDKLEELEKKYEKKLKFLGVGPLPPYNFTKIEIKRINFNTMNEARKALGLGQEVSMSEINSAYDLLAREYHPDLHPDDPFAEEKFKKIKNAHDLLTKYCEHYRCSLEKSKVEETVLIQEKAS